MHREGLAGKGDEGSMRLPWRPSRLTRMFWHDRMCQVFWDSRHGRAIAFSWGFGVVEWLAFGALRLTLWNVAHPHEHLPLHVVNALIMQPYQRPGRGA
jgi:hypothetical protein